MAGWITRVITVTYGPRYHRLPSHIPPRYVDERRPSHRDSVAVAAFSAPVRGCSAGPCGSAARSSAAGAWKRALEELAYYVTRWGTNPLGTSERMGHGAKEGKRGRGPQDYLFQRKGAGDESK